MGSHDSFYDPIRPTVDVATVRPYYEDRVLVKWEPPPAQPGLIQALAPSPRDKGPQFGVVVAVGPGNSGLHKKPTGEQVRASGTPRTVFRPFTKCHACKAEGSALAGRHHAGCTVRPGDRVYYQRRPDNEFISGGETYTAVFEEQDILAVIE